MNFFKKTNLIAATAALLLTQSIYADQCQDLNGQWNGLFQNSSNGPTTLNLVVGKSASKSGLGSTTSYELSGNGVFTILSANTAYHFTLDPANSFCVDESYNPDNPNQRRIQQIVLTFAASSDIFQGYTFASPIETPTSHGFYVCYQNDCHFTWFAFNRAGQKGRE